MQPVPPTIFLVAHGDHNFHRLQCTKQSNRWKGHMDNLLGVYTVLQAYFSGKLPKGCVNIQITYGQQKSRLDENGNWVSFLGAREVMQQVKEDDLVIVIDVTSMPEKYKGLDFTIQKCKNRQLRSFFEQTFADKYKYQIFEDTPDTEATQDQTDAFRQITNNVVFLGMLVYGGDYNRVPVYSNFESQNKSVNAIIDLCQHFEKSWKKYLEVMPKSLNKLSNEQFKTIFQKLGSLQQEVIEESKSEELVNRWKTARWKFIYSPEKRILTFSQSKQLFLRQLLQSIRKLSFLGSVIKQLTQPKQAAIIIKVASTNILRQLEDQKINHNKEFITEIYKFRQKSQSKDLKFAFIILNQKLLFRIGVLITK